MGSRILYGVQGEGRGHATRSLRVLQALIHEGHEVLVLTGGDALSVLTAALGNRVLEIPLLRYHYNARGALCPWRTAARNLRVLARMACGDARLEAVLKRFRPDAVLSDFEPVSCRFARAFRLPLLAIDHQHFLTETMLPRVRGLKDALRLGAYRFGTHFLSGWPRRVIVSSFHHFPRKRGSRASFVGPFLPEDIRRFPARAGAHVTIYLKRRHYLAKLLPTLAWFPDTGFEIFSDWSHEWCLGLPRHVTLHPVSRPRFLESLASARALVTTAGNQVLGEALWLGKPVLALPEPGVLEQDFNARALEQSGCGMRAAFEDFSPSLWEGFELRRAEFLAGLDAFQADHPQYDGLESALRRIRRLLAVPEPARVMAARSPKNALPTVSLS
jgi:uncharacterized protein (TIGR00661 family)